jgi:hypothetical protein
LFANTLLFNNISELSIKKKIILDKNINLQTKNICHFNNDFLIIKKPIDYILENPYLLSDDIHFVNKHRRYMNDLINIGRYSNIIRYFNIIHKYGRCTTGCKCYLLLYEIKQWNDIIEFYNRKNDDYLQNVSFINFVHYIKIEKLLSNEELLSLSKLIKDPVNKTIFIKNTNGEYLTIAYKFPNYKKERILD